MGNSFWWNLFGVIVIVICTVLYFRHYFLDYLEYFFPGRALILALVKTGLVIGLIVGLFFAADRLFAWWMAPGFWRQVLAYLVPWLLVDWIGRPLVRLFDRLQGL